MIPEILFLVKQVGSRGSQVYDLWASISVLLQSGTFEAVECVRDPLSSAYYTLVLVISKTTFIADAYEGCGSDVGIANRAFAVALVAETSDGNT